MSRYIADVIRDKWLHGGENEHIYDKNNFLDSIDYQPTADIEPVRHAHWEYLDTVFSYEGEFGAYVCSNCNRAFLDDLCQDNGSEMVDVGEEFKYCPYCGARMDEEEP